MIENDKDIATITSELAELLSPEETKVIADMVSNWLNAPTKLSSSRLLSKALKESAPPANVATSDPAPEDKKRKLESPTEEKEGKSFKPQPIVWDVPEPVVKKDIKLPESKRFKPHTEPAQRVKIESEPSRSDSNREPSRSDFQREPMSRNDPRRSNNTRDYNSDRRDYSRDNRNGYNQDRDGRDGRTSHRSLSNTPRSGSFEVDVTPLPASQTIQPKIEIVAPAGFSPYSAPFYPQTQITCRFFPGCLNPVCPFVHPTSATSATGGPGQIPCKYGLNCLRPGCYYTHPLKTATGETPTPTGQVSMRKSSTRSGSGRGGHISQRGFAMDDSADDPGSNSDGITGIEIVNLVVI
jgi:RNA-binding, Nab2-type zinc finger